MITQQPEGPQYIYAADKSPFYIDALALFMYSQRFRSNLKKKHVKPASLILKTGKTFSGFCPDWVSHDTTGEVVFNTGMVGYVECLTDPSYAGQILAFTYPLIGNYGVPESSFWESDKIQACGLITSTLETFYARDNAYALDAWCKAQNIPFMTGVDTRALTLYLRDKGTLPGLITTNPDAPKNVNAKMTQHIVKTVSIKKPIIHGRGDKTLIVVDCGIKANILRHLKKMPFTLKQVPFDYDYTQETYDGVFVSNGPGDPQACKDTIAILKKAMLTEKPIFGICLGAQLMALASGATTYKLPFGHRSQNQPCLDLKTQKAYLTSQNHGYAIDKNSLPSDWMITLVNLNDDTVQGIQHKVKPFVAVQFHPEASPGPSDTAWFFNQCQQSIETCHATNED